MHRFVPKQVQGLQNRTLLLSTYPCLSLPDGVIKASDVLPLSSVATGGAFALLRSNCMDTLPACSSQLRGGAQQSRRKAASRHACQCMHTPRVVAPSSLHILTISLLSVLATSASLFSVRNVTKVTTGLFV
jgi:hypothetical protein